ncbi:MAG: signal peptidase I [Acidimicrobiaceae bacterium]|nr:signal peptidase I [Acidimicrobiaceae bacterium]
MTQILPEDDKKPCERLQTSHISPDSEDQDHPTERGEASDPGLADAVFCEHDDSQEKPRGFYLKILRSKRDLVVLATATVVLSLLLKAFVVQAFYIPSESMIPTLLINDRVLVEKISYRFRDIKRGDIVVFNKPTPGYHISELIKRVVAVGGDTFEIQDGIIYVNDEPLDESYLPADVDTLPKWPIPDCGNPARRDYCEVPLGKILVLGDNREHSRDGRFYGPVDTDSVIGRAFVKVWPLDRVGFFSGGF